jgi:hypothetical protein
LEPVESCSTVDPEGAVASVRKLAAPIKVHAHKLATD